MCGIIATINAGHWSRDSRDFLANGVLVGAVRGQDSTGIVQVDKKGSIYTHKLALSGSAFLANKTTAAFLNDSPRCPINIVHHRAATMGKVSDENAHPFVCTMSKVDPVSKRHYVLVGVHNGSLINWKTKPDAAAYDVDSEWALAHIAVHGLNAFKDIEGPYCFMWVTSEEPNKLIVARNSGRPMHAIFTKDRKEVYFASEAGMLAWLCERNRIVTEDQIMVLGTDKAYTFDTSGDTVKITVEDLPKKIVAAVTTVHDDKWNYAGQAKDKQLNAAGQAFINKVKAAAKPAVPAAIIDAAVIDKTIADITADTPWSTDDDGEYVADKVPASWYSDRNATTNEKQKAQAWDMFRELQWFQGVTYDNETGEVLGDIEVWDSKLGKVKYSGIIRGCSEARANSEYIQDNLRGGTNGNWVVVIGAREERQLGKVLVVAELTQAGKAGLEKLYASN